MCFGTHSVVFKNLKSSLELLEYVVKHVSNFIQHCTIIVRFQVDVRRRRRRGRFVRSIRSIVQRLLSGLRSGRSGLQLLRSLRLLWFRRKILRLSHVQGLREKSKVNRRRTHQADRERDVVFPKRQRRTARQVFNIYILKFINPKQRMLLKNTFPYKSK